MTNALVEQFLPALGTRDAVGRHTLECRRALGEAGIAGDIWVAGRFEKQPSAARNFRQLGRPRADRLLLYQVASSSSGIVDFLLTRPEAKSLCHHNITPWALWEPFDPIFAAHLREARAELERLAATVKVALACSEFNAAELRELGIPAVTVVPPYLGELPPAADTDRLEQLRAGKRGVDLLFVGRIVPHKGHVHLIRLLAALRANADPHARLFLVGAPGPPYYMDFLERTRQRLCPEGVVFTGSVTGAQLTAHYAAADLFVCMSEHEGFGVPLIEAMRMGLPVVAARAGAVAETLAGSGVLVDRHDPLAFAEIISRLASDEVLRREIVSRQDVVAKAAAEFPRDRLVVETARAALAN